MTVQIHTDSAYLAQTANAAAKGQHYAQPDLGALPMPLERVPDANGREVWASRLVPSDECDTHPLAVAHRAHLTEHVERIAGMRDAR